MSNAFHRTGYSLLVPTLCPQLPPILRSGRIIMVKLLRHAYTVLLCLMVACVFVWLDSHVLGGLFLNGALSGRTAPVAHTQAPVPDLPTERRPANAMAVEQGEGDDDAQDSKLPFLFVDVYSEQIGRSINNFARLLTYSGKLRRRLVEPFVHGSRLSGLRRKDIHTPQDFSYYFNADALRNLLHRRHQPPLATVREMLAECPHGWDLVLLLQHQQAALSRPEVGGGKHMKGDVDKCRQAAEHSDTGYVECPVLAKLGRLHATQHLNRKAEPAEAHKLVQRSRGIVVNANTYHDLLGLARLMAGSHCVQLMEWAGEGEKRAQFQGLSALEERRQVRPYQILHSQALIERARQFARTRLGGGRYIAIHLRAEKLAKYGTNNDGFDACLKSVASTAAKLRQKLGGANVKIFLATDLADHGSDTMQKHLGEADRVQLQRSAQTMLPGIVVPGDFGLVDRGARAIIEMEVAAAATELIAVGGGNFQEWMAVLFRKTSGRAATRECMQSKIPSGWEYAGDSPS